MEHTFHVRSTEKFPEISEVCKGSPVYPLETFQWKCMFHLQVFIRNHQFQAIHGDICVTILNFVDEHQKMELVSNGTRSSFDGPLPSWKLLKVFSKWKAPQITHLFPFLPLEFSIFPPDVPCRLTCKPFHSPSVFLENYAVVLWLN